MTPDVGHGRKCLCTECTSARLAIEASSRRFVEHPDNPWIPQQDHVMTIAVAPAARLKRSQ